MQEITENRFNLVEEPWIPVADFGLASLRQIFTDPSLRALGGNPVLKIAITKLLLAISQAAFTPKDEDEWREIGADGIAEKAINYLEEKKDLFWLYGEKPFLQMVEISKAGIQKYGAVQYYIATGNTTVLNQSQVDKDLTDAEKAQLLISIMGFAPGGKKTDNSVVLSKDYTGKSNDKGKPSTGKPGPSLGFAGYLHNLLTGNNLRATIWLNIISQEQIADIPFFISGVGTPPWEQMPEGENCETANRLKNSYMGRLVSLNRFILLKNEGLHYSEGISHPSHKEGGFDLTIAVDFSKDPKAIWVDPEKRPWRQLTSLLSFFSVDQKNSLDCRQLRFGVLRAKNAIPEFSIWSGGINVSSNAGEQFVTGMNDFVESEITLYSKSLGEIWFQKLKEEMTILDDFSKSIYASTMGYFKKLKSDGKKTASLASNLYWQLCEQKFQDLINACDDATGRAPKKLRYEFANFVNKAYNTYCPCDTARQLDAWAANRPNIGKYLTDK